MSTVQTVEGRISDVEAKSSHFRKELRLVDLVLMQILYVVGSIWVGTAAKLGSSHIAFWLLAVALFYLPQAAVVIFLNRLMPLEGGIYQWATVGLGEFAGFLVAWNLWAYTLLIIATFGVIISTNLSYLIGPIAPWLTGAPWYTAAVSSAAIVGMTAVSLFGLRIGKWVQNVGGAAQLLTYIALIIVPFVALRRGTLTQYHPMAASVPTITPLSINIFSKMALGALSGFEYVAILAGETRSPARTIGRSVSIAAPIIVLMFIFGTSSVSALVPADKIDLASPIPQTLTIGFHGMGFAERVVPALIFLLLLRQLGSVTMLFAGNTRLPMVAGWDGLLPAWFTRLHPRFRTPVNSILFVAAVILVLTLAGQAGVGVQEAFQLLDNAAGVFYTLTYLALFAIPLVAAHRLPGRVPLWLKTASASGFVVSLIYCVFSVFPIIEVASWQQFAAKIIAVLVVANLIGASIYMVGRRRGTARRATNGTDLPNGG